MIEFGDEWDGEEARLRASIIRRARTEGIAAAYEAALAICRDSKAPQQAKSNAARTLLQIGGLFERHEGGRKEPHEMTLEELEAERVRLRRQAREFEPPAAPRKGLFD
jgi:hypothetical protein